MDRLARNKTSQPAEMSDDPPRRDLVRRASRLILPAVFVAWLAFLTISSPVFLTWQNISNVTRQVAVVGLLSLGQLAVILTGNIDLSSASLMGLFGAILAGQSKVMAFPVALVLALSLALAWGLGNGFLVTRGRNISVIVTLSTGQSAQVVITDAAPATTPTPYPASGVMKPAAWVGIGIGSVLAIPLLIFSGVWLKRWRHRGKDREVQ